MRDSEIIKFGGKELTVKEICIKDIDKFLSKDTNMSSSLDRLFAQEGVTAMMISLATGISEEDLSQYTPSAIEEIVIAIKKVNKFFFRMVKAEDARTKEFIKLRELNAQ